MKYILLDYVNESGWPELTREEQAHWLGVYRAYMEAMQRAGVLKSSGGLRQTPTATTVRIRNDKTQVLEGRTPMRRNSWAAFTSSKCPISMRRYRGQRVRRLRCTEQWKCGRCMKERS